MNILGICDSQDAGAVIIDEKNSITAVNEERLSGVKLCGGFPERSIKEVLRITNTSLKKIDLVVLASHMTPSWFLRAFPKFHSRLRNTNKQFSFLLAIYILYQIIARKSAVIMWLESQMSRLIIKKRLNKIGIKAKVVTVEHHAAHAYAAYATSGFDNALIFTIDGLGDGISFTVNIGNAGKIKRVFEQQAFNDITLYYSRLTEFSGFIPIQDEGKVMGLAGYSNSYNVLPEAEKLLRIEKGRFKWRNLFFFCSADKRIFKSLKGKKREEIAASFQFHLERILLEIVSYWIEKTQIKNVIFSGGFFANIKVNQRVAQLKEVNELYVYPHMGDGGLAVGAVCAVKKIKPFRFKNLFLGASFSKEYVLNFLKTNKIKFEYVNNLAQRVAYLLSQGYIIARFSAGMEYGPRALGNRSILCQATDVGIQKILNEKLNRNDFMPFAPAILSEYKESCCLMTEKAVYSANFMNVSFDCTDYFKTICPAVVHKDGTTRPQFVDADSNPGFYNILKEYHRLTGIPAVINTSFNIHEEPIICAPEDALRVFKKGRLDYLVIENYLVKGADLYA